MIFKMKRLLHWHLTMCNSLLFILRLYLSRRAAIYVLLVSKAKKTTNRLFQRFIVLLVRSRELESLAL